MAEARRLPLLKLMAPALAKFQPYIGREPPDEYMDRVIQSWCGQAILNHFSYRSR